MLGLATKYGKRVLMLFSIVAITLLAVRVYDTQRGLPLDVWHTYVPHELSARELDTANWSKYLQVEDKIFEALRVEVRKRLTPEERVSMNRYFEGSPVYPAFFAGLEPLICARTKGRSRWRGRAFAWLTNCPYSLRHIARYYRDHGFVAIAIRLPAHGTVPGALTDIEWETWAAATRLAVREARRRTPPSSALHIVGFSNGGSLALKYALKATQDRRLKQADRLVLISPMVGITRFARFAGLASLPAIFPAFTKAAWLSVLPEFNPFKYNSFPVNGARQSYRLTDALQKQISLYERQDQLAGLPPILTFQSIIDFTVSTPAVLSALYAHLPSNGSEIVLFDVNRNIKFGPLFRPAVYTALTRIVPPGKRNFRLTIVTNADAGTNDAVERTVEAGATIERTRAWVFPTLLASSRSRTSPCRFP